MSDYLTPYGRNPRLLVVTDCPDCNGTGEAWELVDEEGTYAFGTCQSCNGAGEITSAVPLGDVAEWVFETLGLLPAFFEWLAMQSPSSLPDPLPASGVQAGPCTPSSCSSNGGVQ